VAVHNTLGTGGTTVHSSEQHFEKSWYFGSSWYIGFFIQLFNTVPINGYCLLWLAFYPSVQKTLDSTPYNYSQINNKKPTVTTKETQHIIAAIQTPVNTPSAQCSKWLIRN